MTIASSSDATELCQGIFSRAVPDTWIRDLPAVSDVLRTHFSFDPLTTVLPPSSTPDRLRYELMIAAPELSNLGCTTMNILSGAATVVIVPKLHLGSLSIEERTAMLYALSVVMGYPTGTDPRESTVVWPVTARATNGAYFATYSELDSEAEYHTDAQYYPDPERYFFLYVNRAARCGGGVSRVRSNVAVIEHLESTEEGRKALTLLRNRLYPFRIPSAYTKSGGAEEVDYTYAPVLSGGSVIRWRRDTLDRGLTEQVDFDSPEVRQATAQLAHAFEVAPEEYVMNLPDDSLILVDNHRAVHARTAFRDHARSLFRVRFHDKQHVR